MNYFSRRKTESIDLIEVEVSWLGIKGKWKADREQQTAAWEMYVELVTRIAIQPLGDDRGLLREALSSLYSLFPETRRILKSHGPRAARKLSDDAITFAHVAIAVLNVILRPVLSKWHPALQEHEVTKDAAVSAFAHEKSWSDNAALRAALNDVREQLTVYADLLAEAAGIDPLHVSGAKR